MRANFRCKPCALVVWIFLLNVPVFGQSPALWSGAAQCTVTEQDQTYQCREVQTWALTGAAPTQQGAMQIYPATWTDTGVIPFIELHGLAHDRPIGLTDGSSDPTSSTILPNATIVLTRELIEKRLGANNWTMLSIDFKDTAHGFTALPGSDRPGGYMMFIQIERQ